MLDAVIQTEEPLKTILISFVMSILTCVSVIIIGAGIEKIQKLEIKLLMHFMSPKKALFIADRLTFPGTMLHEIAHALIAWTTGAVIQKIKLLTFSTLTDWVMFISVREETKFSSIFSYP